MTVENVGLYAETLVRQVVAGGQALDYSRESLAVLDELLALSDPLYEVSSDPQRDLVIFYTGCYLGEVLVRTLGAQWQLTEHWGEASLKPSEIFVPFSRYEPVKPANWLPMSTVKVP